jgi:RNA polymerase sigma-70 factor (ECF subfamily)
MFRPPLVHPSGLAALRAAVQAMLDPPRPALATSGAPARTAAGVPVPARTPAGPHGREGDLTYWVAMSTADAAASSRELDRLPAPGRPVSEDPDTHRVTALVDRARSGDTEAFAALYDRYLDTVFRYVYYRVGSRPLAEDLTSETFLRALRRISTFTWQGRDFGAWLVTIARNLVADHFKSGRFRLEVTTGEMLDADEVQEGPEGMVMESFTNAALIEAVKRLNPHQQECLVLRFLQGLSVAETARIMGKNEGAIKTLQYRAVRALAQLLPEDVR